MTTSDIPEPLKITEEHFLDTGTDVEAEIETEDAPPEIDRPWNPEQIRVNTKQFSLRNALDMIEDESLELAPDFQRGRVWKPVQKSRLIESVLLQIPLPAFYFAEDTDGLMRVVDGLQRLSTIHDFVRGGDKQGFPLKGLEYLQSAVEGKRFEDLPAPWKRRIYNTQIVTNVIDPTTPADVMYDIFKRINTGGTPLNAQEIRHCMSKDRSRRILREMTFTAEFNEATNGMGGHIRMNDREMALRFAAFWLMGTEGYAKYAAMDSFLQRTTTVLDSAGEADARVDGLMSAFRKAMVNARLVFGEQAFRKWPLYSTGRNPINRALFETWSITLAAYEAADLEQRREAIVAAARQLMSRDYRYLEAITSSTGDVRRVRYRFEATARAAEAGK
ncbi:MULTISPECIES: DUF262 domain-containing protein [unclassified Streptomyces]|uniref:DUF262 domain-containing protein n=1 Tax=unclassified Streptomyces TaxID=2593676 RepID=UPI000747A620|nr:MULTISPECIES: DUF262 domain-containing protein [unclassified Streptomyces]KUL62713.1 hypothetical protein ADL30_04765 [Streptomyces sp. NRRL S-1521]THC45908.1 DUF262 domain-containing protein [Streptomyces sp. A1499]